jgi:hypothetical protein
MFSFGYVPENGESMCTPFFEENFENHSIFTTQDQSEFNVYDLFNSSDNQHIPYTRQKIEK